MTYISLTQIDLVSLEMKSYCSMDLFPYIDIYSVGGSVCNLICFCFKGESISRHLTDVTFS